MTRRIFEFSCGRHITDSYIGEDILQIKCHICGSPADRIISSPTVVLEGITGDFPSSAMKWEKRHPRITNSEQ